MPKFLLSPKYALSYGSAGISPTRLWIPEATAIAIPILEFTARVII